MAKNDVILGMPDEWYQNILDMLAPQLEEKANAAGDRIDAPTGVQMKRDRNGRPVAMLGILHPKGLAMQAKYASLTKAAAAEGFDVRRYPRR